MRSQLQVLEPVCLLKGNSFAHAWFTTRFTPTAFWEESSFNEQSGFRMTLARFVVGKVLLTSGWAIPRTDGDAGWPWGICRAATVAAHQQAEYNRNFQ